MTSAGMMQLDHKNGPSSLWQCFARLWFLRLVKASLAAVSGEGHALLRITTYLLLIACWVAREPENTHRLAYFLP